MMEASALICVDPARIGEVWPLVRERLKLAIEQTDLSDFIAFEANVLSGKQLLWLAWDGTISAVATTEKSSIGTKTICTLTACQGYQREKWLPLFGQIEEYARNEGCSTMRLYGRRGWERVLDGYNVEHIVMEKDLGRN